LVLDGVNGSEGSPVLGVWESDFGENGWLWELSGIIRSDGGVEWGLVSEKFFVLGSGPGGHEVVSNGEGVGGIGVDLGIFNSVGIEDSLSEDVFFLGSVGDTVVSDVLEEIGAWLSNGFETKGEGGFSEHLFF